MNYRIDLTKYSDEELWITYTIYFGQANVNVKENLSKEIAKQIAQALEEEVKNRKLVDNLEECKKEMLALLQENEQELRKNAKEQVEFTDRLIDKNNKQS